MRCLSPEFITTLFQAMLSLNDSNAARALFAALTCRCYCLPEFTKTAFLAGLFRTTINTTDFVHAESKIEAQTSPPRLKGRVGKDVTLWCNATGYPRPVVYWTREDSHRKLSDGTYQFWVRAHTSSVGQNQTNNHNQCIFRIKDRSADKSSSREGQGG